MSEVRELTDRTWEKSVEKATDPVVILFYSPTCSHCRTMMPYFEAYAEELEGTVAFVRIDITANPWTAQRYGIMSTPTFAIFCSGRSVAQIVGAVYPTLVKKMIEDGIRNAKECAGSSTVIDYEITGYG
ncbi:thioredoxin [Methanocalculus chunghsingensis]|uniref:Thioredoxin n=1 Tax=Methanocalculus chunghsingensis TaxID=156457 RepID=A0A8J7W4N6_9EURY|nr:thioredoxin family protein [Methanocalculus chunghsingensis]MBR1368209.1 thioredoxin [Methanocalculus chunghsingensis]